jgi:hypothetical protein
MAFAISDSPALDIEDLVDEEKETELIHGEIKGMNILTFTIFTAGGARALRSEICHFYSTV